MSRKLRSDAWWAGLSRERLDQIIEWLDTPKSDSCPGGMQHAREQLAADGVRVSDSQLTRFWAWHQLDARYSFMRQTCDQLQEMAAAKGIELNKARELAQGMFELQSIQGADPETFIALQRLELDRRTAEAKGKKLELDIAKFEVTVCEKFLEWFTDDKARGIAESKASNAEKIAALRKAYFADVDKLAKENPLKLPE